ncbi:MAG: hypothetical protein MHM6MM_008416 [Cercozoa sp. M6MM]
MGKKRSSRKLFYSSKEWREHGGGKQTKRERTLHSVLPFDHCQLSLQPWKEPVASPDGYIFDRDALLEWQAEAGNSDKHPKKPSQKLRPRDLITLKVHRNANGQLHCPLSLQLFSEHARICAVVPEGAASAHCYSYSAVLELFSDQKGTLREPLTGAPVTKKCILVLQDPQDPEWQQKHGVGIVGEHDAELNEEVIEAMRARKRLKLLQDEKRRRELAKQAEAEKSDQDDGRVKFLAADSTSKLGAGFTSTSMAAVTQQKRRELSQREIDERLYLRLRRTRKRDRRHGGKVGDKAYVRLVTSVGQMVFELHSDLVPRAVHNFLLLAAEGTTLGTCATEHVCH